MRERGFELLEHTADVGVHAWGPDLAAAFEEAARGMSAVMVDLDAVRPLADRRVEVAGADTAELLVRWLNEIAYLADAEGMVFSRFAVERMTAASLTATAYGESLDPARHRPRVAVKAATYHDLDVRLGPPAEVRVLLDI